MAFLRIFSSLSGLSAKGTVARNATATNCNLGTRGKGTVARACDGYLGGRHRRWDSGGYLPN